MVTARLRCATTLLVAMLTACVGATPPSTPVIDATVADRGLPLDASNDLLAPDHPALTCTEPYLYLDVALEDGQRFEQCLPLSYLSWWTSACLRDGFSADVNWAEGRNEVTTHVGWDSTISPGPFPFLREGEYGFAGSFTLSNRRCNPPPERCDLIQGIGAHCCDFNTRGAHSCRWAVRRAGRAGDTIEAELVAPCTYIESTYDGRVHTPPRTVTVMHARLRGVLRRIDTVISQPDVVPGFYPEDCGF